MAFHDEYERALGSNRRSMSRIAKIAMVLGVVFLVGAAAVAALAWMAVRTVADEFDQLRENPATVVAERLIDAAPELELLSSDVDAGTVTYRTRSSQDVRTVEAEEFLEGRLRIHTEDGDLTVDLNADERSGRLVIRTGDGEVLRLDAQGEEDGGSLVVRSQDGEVFRLEGRGLGDDSGELRLRVDGEEVVRLEIDGDGDDAVLRLHGEDGSVSLRGVREGGDVPGWVPGFRGMDAPRVYTADADEGIAGAVRFRTDVPLAEVMDHYQDALGRAGNTRSHRWQVLGSRFQATVTGEVGEGRTVMVLGLGSEDGSTQVVVTWAETD